MARSGMSGLIKRLRQITETSEGDYSILNETYWNDDHLQDVLDEHRTRLDMVTLNPRPEQVSGDYVYKRYELPGGIRFVEGVTTGDDGPFKITDAVGAPVTQADYSLNDRDLAITFGSDQEGASFYWSGYAYDLPSAARQVWETKAAHVWTAVNFSVDWQRFDREALYQHCIDMAKRFGYSSGGGATGGNSSIKAATLKRTDLAASETDRF